MAHDMTPFLRTTDSAQERSARVVAMARGALSEVAFEHAAVHSFAPIRLCLAEERLWRGDDELCVRRTYAFTNALFWHAAFERNTSGFNWHWHRRIAEKRGGGA
jgi:hypothetical protein